MTQEEALALVMCRYGKMEAASRKRKSAAASNQRFKGQTAESSSSSSSAKRRQLMHQQNSLEAGGGGVVDGDGVEDVDDGPIDEHLQVEIDWGDEDHNQMVIKSEM